MTTFSIDDDEDLELPLAGEHPGGHPPAWAGARPRAHYLPRPATLERAREIREIAARFITDHGLWRFSMLALARHLQCLLPTLCYYYKKREDLITDMVMRHIDGVRTRTSLAMDAVSDGNPAGELHAFAQEYLLAGIAERDFHRLTIGFAELAGPREGQSFLTRRETLREIVERRLTLHAPSLAGKPETARALSHALIDALNGAACWLEPYGIVKPAAYAGMIADWVLAEAARA
jgi:AcrR family transcriptional regulator